MISLRFLRIFGYVFEVIIGVLELCMGLCGSDCDFDVGEGGLWF